MLLADGRVVKGHISHSPFPPKKVAGLAMDVERLVYGLPCIITKSVCRNHRSRHDSSRDNKTRHCFNPNSGMSSLKHSVAKRVVQQEMCTLVFMLVL